MNSRVEGVSLLGVVAEYPFNVRLRLFIVISPFDTAVLRCVAGVILVEWLKDIVWVPMAISVLGGLVVGAMRPGIRVPRENGEKLNDCEFEKLKGFCEGLSCCLGYEACRSSALTI